MLIFYYVNYILYNIGRVLHIANHRKCKEVIVMRELFVEKVIDLAEEFLDNNQRIKLKEILTEVCLDYHIEIKEHNILKSV